MSQYSEAESGSAPGDGNPLRSSFLDSVRAGPGRRFAKPLALLPHCRLGSGGAWADLGCGEGVFTAVLAELLGSDGKVLGLDKDPAALRSLRVNLKNWRPRGQVQPVHADFQDPLPFAALDGVLAANALHFIPDEGKGAVLRQFGQALVKGGSLIIVEYNAARGTGAVPHPLSAQAWTERLRGLGFDRVRVAARTASTYLDQMVAVQAQSR